MGNCLNVDIIRAKIKQKKPLTSKEYAFAVLYLNLNPETYSFNKQKEQTEEAKMPNTTN